MSTYTNQWRQTAGCVMLLTSIVLMAFWLRSLIAFDRIDVLLDPQNLWELKSNLSQLSWTRIIHPIYTDVLPYWSGPAFKFDVFADCQIIWRWRMIGFDFGHAIHTDTKMEFIRWTVPYWFIVVVTTLLSTFLLISKPRNEKSNSMTERSETPS